MHIHLGSDKWFWIRHIGSIGIIYLEQINFDTKFE